MKGKYRIIIENRKIKYDFEIKRNITIIKGDSATGKTTLIDMVAEYYENGPDSGIQLQCSRQCIVLRGKDWKLQLLSGLRGNIVFIDEGNSFITTKEFASYIQKTDNYYVIVTREALPMLPYSVNEIYGIHNSGRYGTLRKVYNEMYPIYGQFHQNEPMKPHIVITEDSGSGFQFFEKLCQDKGSDCISAYGKSNIFEQAKKVKNEETVLIIADGAAFGSEIEKMVSLFYIQKNFYLYLPESFEWLILKSGVIKGNDIIEMIERPYDFVESSKYASWEQFFCALLVEKTKDTYLAYTKKELNPVYLQGNIVVDILKQMKEDNEDII